MSIKLLHNMSVNVVMHACLPVYAGGWTSPSAIDAIAYAQTVLLDSRVEQVQIELSLQVQTRRLIRHWLDKTSGDIYHTHFCVIPHVKW